MTRETAAFALLCIIFGTTFGAIKIEMAENWPPLLAGGLRFVLAGSLVLSLAALRGELRLVSRRALGAVIVVGLTMTAVPFGALYWAERILPSGVCALLSATSPLFAVVIAVATRARRFDRFAAAGIVLGTAGVALVAGVGAISGQAAFVAAGAIVVSEFAFAWGLGRARPVAASVPMLQFAGTQQLAGGVVLLSLSALGEHRWVTPSAAGISSFVYLVLIGTAAAHTVATWLAARTNATFASSWTYISPFVALAFGALLLGERIALSAWIGGVCVIAGALALNAEPRRRSAPVLDEGRLAPN